MQQFLIIIRGAPASGKSTISKQLRDFEKKIVWLKVDNFKDFFSDDVTLEEQRFVDESSLATLEYLLDQGFSVVMEKIFYDPFVIHLAVKAAKKRNIQVATFQIKCSLATLQKRDRNRPGIKEGCRKPMGDEKIKDIYNHLEQTSLKGAIILDTEKLKDLECTKIIKHAIGYE